MLSEYTLADTLFITQTVSMHVAMDKEYPGEQEAFLANLNTTGHLSNQTTYDARHAELLARFRQLLRSMSVIRLFGFEVGGWILSDSSGALSLL